MFWIGAGSIVIMFFGCKSYLNNKIRWQKRRSPIQSSRIYFWLLQGGNLLLIVAALLFLMLAIVCHTKGLQIHFSSDYTYHMQLDGYTSSP